MSERGAGGKVDEGLGRCLLWDLAGTLLAFDPLVGRSSPLPGWETALPDLARNWRLFVTTGEESRSARGLLGSHGMLPVFEEIFGDLLNSGGKPHGEILREIRGRPELSLVIGDRLQGDVPADTDELVLLLVNQGGEILNAAMIAATVGQIRETAPTIPEAFRALSARAEPDPDALGPCGGGAITAAWRSDELAGARLWIFEPDWMERRQMVIVV